MARKRKYKTKSIRSSRSYFKAKTRRRKGGGDGLIMTMIGATAYGAGREYVSELISPVTTQFAGVVGNVADEVGMLAISYALAKGKIPFLNKVKMSRKIGQAGVIIESARIGSTLIAGTIGGVPSGNSVQVGNPTVF